MPPHTIILCPVQTADACERLVGTFAPVEVAAHVSPLGSYRPPVFEHPPQTIIFFDPVHTAVW
jgi:hypothetical protein